MSRSARIELLPADDSGTRVGENDQVVTVPPSQRAHYLRLVASNGQVLATSETYSTRANARTAVRAWVQAFCEAANAYPAGDPVVIECDASGTPR